MGNCVSYLLCANAQEDSTNEYLRPTPLCLSFQEDLTPVQDSCEVLQNISIIEELPVPDNSFTPFKKPNFRRTLSSTSDLDSIIPLHEAKAETERLGFRRSFTRTFSNNKKSFIGRFKERRRQRSTLNGGNFRYDGSSDESTFSLYQDTKERGNRLEMNYISKHNGDSEP